MNFISFPVNIFSFPTLGRLGGFFEKKIRRFGAAGKSMYSNVAEKWGVLMTYYDVVEKREQEESVAEPRRGMPNDAILPFVLSAIWMWSCWFLTFHYCEMIFNKLWSFRKRANFKEFRGIGFWFCGEKRFGTPRVGVPRSGIDNAGSTLRCEKEYWFRIVRVGVSFYRSENDVNKKIFLMHINYGTCWRF